MTRKDRMDRIKALWQTLLDSADSENRIPIGELQKIRADFMLQQGISNNTLGEYMSILHDVNAWRWNDTDPENLEELEIILDPIYRIVDDPRK